MDPASSAKTAVLAGWQDAMRAVVGRDNLRGCEPSSAFADVSPQTLVEPANEHELAQILKIANQNGLAVIPRGGGTKLDWGNPPTRADLLLSTARLNRILEHAWADLTVTVEAGCTIRKLQQALAKHGQRIAFDPLWPDRATVGGVLSANDSGALRLRFGSLRDLIIGVTLALPDGTLASSGGKVVKNVAGYDLPKLATGALGTLGIITRAVFRLHPLPQFSQTLTIQTENIQDAQRIVLSIQSSKLAHVSLQIRSANHQAPELDIQFEGTTPGIIAQRSHLEALIAPLAATDAAASVWNARQELFSLDPQASHTAIAKISVLPASIASTAETIVRISDTHKLHWTTVVQATGLGCLRLNGEEAEILAALTSLRSEIEKHAGSLVLLRRSTGMPAFDAWGNPGDALPLMRAVKQQFDPRGTLNLGRFVGGI